MTPDARDLRKAFVDMKSATLEELKNFQVSFTEVNERRADDGKGSRWKDTEKYASWVSDDEDLIDPLSDEIEDEDAIDLLVDDGGENVDMIMGKSGEGEE